MLINSFEENIVCSAEYGEYNGALIANVNYTKHELQQQKNSTVEKYAFYLKIRFVANRARDTSAMQDRWLI